MKVDVKYTLSVLKFSDHVNEYILVTNVNDVIYEYHFMIDINESGWIEYLSEMIHCYVTQSFDRYFRDNHNPKISIQNLINKST